MAEYAATISAFKCKLTRAKFAKSVYLSSENDARRAAQKDWTSEQLF
jgi:hypothetical protein